MARNAPSSGDDDAPLRHEALRGVQGLEGSEGVYFVGEEAFDGDVDPGQGLSDCESLSYVDASVAMNVECKCLEINRMLPRLGRRDEVLSVILMGDYDLEQHSTKEILFRHVLLAATPFQFS